MKLSGCTKARIVAGLIAVFFGQYLVRGLIDGWYDNIQKHGPTIRYSRVDSPDDFWVLSVLLAIGTLFGLYHCAAPKPTKLIRYLAERDSKDA